MTVYFTWWNDASRHHMKYYLNEIASQQLIRQIRQL